LKENLYTNFMLSKIDELTDPEEEVIERIHPSHFDTRHIKGTIIYPAVMLIAITALLGLILANIFELGVNPVYIAALYVFPLGMILFYEFRRRFVMYHFTNKKIVEEEGIFNKNINTLHYDNITHSTLDQDLEERVFGVSDIELDSAGESTTEIYLNGIRNASKYKSIIDQHAFSGDNQRKQNNQQDNLRNNTNQNKGNFSSGGEDFDSEF